MLSKKLVFMSFLNRRKKFKEAEEAYNNNSEIRSVIERIAKNNDAFIKAINEKHSKTK